MKRYYYSDRLTTESESLGPVNVEELKELYFEKKITEDCLVCQEGTEDWLKLEELISRYNQSGDDKELEALWEERNFNEDPKKKSFQDHLVSIEEKDKFSYLNFIITDFLKIVIFLIKIFLVVFSILFAIKMFQKALS